MKLPRYTFLYIPYAFMGVGIVFACFLLAKAVALNKESNSYNRVMVCISSVSPTKRTPDYVKACYRQADDHNGTHIERFGDGE